MKKIILIVAFMSIRMVGADTPKVVAQPEPKKEVAVTIKPQEVIDLVNALIKKNESFKVKLSNPLLPEKVRLWQNRGLIKYPTKQVPWVTFKKDIDELNTFLHSLLQKNPHTDTYYHIAPIQKNRALYDTLQKINTALTENESKIIVTAPFKLDKPSLEAMQKLINIYGTTFYHDKLLERIKKFLTAFEKEAKKIRSQEEKAAHHAALPTQKLQPEVEAVEEGSTDSDFLMPESEKVPLYDFDNTDDFIASFFAE